MLRPSTTDPIRTEATLVNAVVVVVVVLVLVLNCQWFDTVAYPVPSRFLDGTSTYCGKAEGNDSIHVESVSPVWYHSLPGGWVLRFVWFFWSWALYRCMVLSIRMCHVYHFWNVWFCQLVLSTTLMIAMSRWKCEHFCMVLIWTCVLSWWIGAWCCMFVLRVQSDCSSVLC